jgi:nucleotidyltransferase/DNA polymerase involved in DNA repair
MRASPLLHVRSLAQARICHLHVFILCVWVVCVSVAQLLAKIAAGVKKPNSINVIPPSLCVTFLGGLPVRKIPGCGHKLEQQLRTMHLDTAATVRRLPLQVLAAQLGDAAAATIFNAVWGVDDAPVEKRGETDSITTGSFFWLVHCHRAFLHSRLCCMPRWIPGLR